LTAVHVRAETLASALPSTSGEGAVWSGRYLDAGPIIYMVTESSGGQAVQLPNRREKNMSKISSTFRRFMQDESGAGMVEYALLVALIGVLLITALGTLRGGISSTFNKANTSLTTGS